MLGGGRGRPARRRAGRRPSGVADPARWGGGRGRPEATRGLAPCAAGRGGGDVVRSGRRVGRRRRGRRDRAEPIQIGAGREEEGIGGGMGWSARVCRPGEGGYGSEGVGRARGLAGWARWAWPSWARGGVPLFSFCFIFLFLFFLFCFKF